MFALIVFIGILIIQYRINNNSDIEKLFVTLIVIIYACFGCAYLSSTSSNNDVLFERAVNSELGFELHEKYLPYYNEYSDLPAEKGEYEIYRGESNGTVMIYVDSNIINSQGYMDYEAEYLKTKNLLIYYKYLTSKINDAGEYSALSGTQSTYNIDGLKLEFYQKGNDYIVLVKNKGEIFYVALNNAINILPEEFVTQCEKQFYLMQETIENGCLLVF